MGASSSNLTTATPRSRVLELAASVEHAKAEERAGLQLLEQYLHLLMLTEYLVSMTLVAPDTPSSGGGGAGGSKGKSSGGKGDGAAAAEVEADTDAGVATVERPARAPKLTAPLAFPLSSTYAAWLGGHILRDDFYYTLDTLREQVSVAVADSPSRRRSSRARKGYV